MDDLEKGECLKILDLLTVDNLLSLTDTVTGRVVTVESKEGIKWSCLPHLKRLSFNSPSCTRDMLGSVLMHNNFPDTTNGNRFTANNPIMK